MEQKRKIYQCCNPFNLNNHRPTKDLRLVSQTLQQSFNLQSTNYLCSRCRKQLTSVNAGASTSKNDIYEIDNINNDASEAEKVNVNKNDSDNNKDIISIEHDKQQDPSSIHEHMTKSLSTNTLPRGPSSLSSEDIMSQLSTLSNLSIRTQLPIVNQALPLLNISPIKSHRLDRSSYLINKFNDICSTIASLLEINCNSNVYLNSQHFVELLDKLKVKFHDKHTSRQEQLQILTLLPSEWSLNETSEIMNAPKNMVQIAKSLAEETGILSFPAKKKGRPLSKEISSNVIEFYTSDEVSVNLPGMKDFILIRNDTGGKERVQKRIILMNLKELYSLYKTNYPDDKIGFSKVASLRPKHCILAGASGTHTICVCAVHQNIKLMITGCNLSILTRDLTSPLENYRDCFKLILCENPSTDCYFRRCDQCPGIDALKVLLIDLFDSINLEDVTYNHWFSNPLCSLETLTKCSSEFIDDFCSDIENLIQHDFIAKQQSQFIKTVKESLQADEFLAVCDFAENYAFIIQNAVSGFHWNNDQATIFPVVVYYKENDILVHKSLIIISDCNIHDAVSVQVFTKIINDFIKSISATASKIFYFSDGAPQQFKNFKHFVNIYYHKSDFGVDAEWHFFASAHGKGPCDGVGEL